MSKKPIDAHRDASFSMDIDDPNDPSPIREIIPLTDKMLIVKDGSVWQIQMADAVDPKRTNINIPHTRQKVMKRGAGDEAVCRTLLQAQRLLKAEFISKPSEPLTSLQATVGVVQDLDVILRMAEDYRDETARLETSLDGTSAQQKGLNLPAVGDAKSRAKAFIQAADHAVKSIWKFARTIETTLSEGVNWQKFKSLLEERDEPSKRIAKVIQQLEGSFAFIRSTRNAIEHEKPDQQVIVQDYKLLATGTVVRPTITIVEKNNPLSETDLNQYFDWVIKFLIDAFEALLINLCAANLKPFGKFEVVLAKLEPEQRRYPSAAYSYAMWMGDRLIPIG